MKKSPKAPKDPNQLAHFIVGKATEEPTPHQPTEAELRSAAAAIIGRLGGLKGGKARADKLSDEEKSRIARDAVNERWEKYRLAKKKKKSKK